MDLQWREGDSEARFAAYVEALSGSLGHADRVAPFRSYCTGLLLPGDRKSVEPMAARLRPDRTSAEHQSLLHFVGQSPWDETALLRAVRAAVLPVMTTRRRIVAWIVDDTGFPKKGRHSVGVGRQYCGQLGKQDNCQVAVSLSVATSEASLPVAWQLYLPEAWAQDAGRRKRARVPQTVRFRTKPEIALDQIASALAEGIAPSVVLADAGYGNSSAFRDGLSELGLAFVVGVSETATVWPQGMTPTVPARTGRGRPPKRLRRGGDDAPVEQVAALAKSLPAGAWRTVAWREGTAEALASRFAALRVRSAQGDHRRSAPRPEQWLLVEWPDDEAEPTKFWFSTLPADTPIDRLVSRAKLRWLIERDYLELKQELGLGHYEGRGWPGFHHHAALCIAAYGFLVAEKAALPPSPREIPWLVEAPELPASYTPRGSANANRATRAPLDRNPAATDRSRPGAKPATMPVLRPDHREAMPCSRFICDTVGLVD
jgi:SRSO17 transposase